ncbi:hypothetical protein GGR56DRAFT_47960 [Xylariaceae sp. FL0804]|nr:hypothetical protein GGR56DRAFT_47960 [Xylariaceae sp. FL0804]
MPPKAISTFMRLSRGGSLRVNHPNRFIQTKSSIYPPEPREYFVLVSDRNGADRSRISPSEMVPSFWNFAGECLSSAESSQPEVRGNAFACHARSQSDVREKMLSSAYCREEIWDMATASITPLLTVHSSEYAVKADGTEKVSEQVEKS